MTWQEDIEDFLRHLRAKDRESGMYQGDTYYENLRDTLLAIRQPNRTFPMRRSY